MSMLNTFSRCGNQPEREEVRNRNALTVQYFSNFGISQPGTASSKWPKITPNLPYRESNNEKNYPSGFSPSDVFTILQEIQRTWSYLEPLFIGSEEVKKELPEDAKRFEVIDTDVKGLLKSVSTGTLQGQKPTARLRQGNEER